MTIVLCSKGYPGKYTNNQVIGNLSKIKLKKNLFLHHAGTTFKNNRLVSNGGRVVNFICLSSNFTESRNKIFNLIKTLNWSGGFFRNDIGYKVINK